MSTAQAVTDILVSRYDGKVTRGGRQVQSRSPYRNGDNKTALSLTVEDDEHGAWHDFVTNESGSLYQLAAHLGIETPKGNSNGASGSVTAAQLTKRPYDNLADYAATHGVSEDVFKAAKWREDTVDGRPALVYPTTTGERIRFMDGQDPRYKSPAGYKICWYGFRNLLGIQHESGLPVIVCNGEASTVVGQYYGLPVCATTGGEGSLNQALLDELLTLWHGDIVLAYDCDEAGKRAAVKVAGMLYERQRTVTILDLQLSTGGDIADFCAIHKNASAEEIRARIKTLAPYEPPDATKIAVESLAQAVGQLAQAVKADAARNDLEVVLANAKAQIDAVQQRSASAPIKSTEGVLQILDSYLASAEFDGLPTGIPALDEAVGGIPNAAVTYIYGATGMGKSTAAASIAARWESMGERLLYISTELQPHHFALRVIAAMSGVPKSHIKRGQYNDPDAAARVRLARQTFSQNQSFFADTIRMSKGALRAAVLSAARGGARAVIVDSVSKLTNAGDYSDGLSMNDELLELSRETGLPFVATVQVSREIEKRTDRIPRLSDAYGGAFIEQNANLVLALYRHDYYIKVGLAEPDERYPAGSVAYVILKSRDPEDESAVGARITCQWVGGAGIYPAKIRKFNLGDDSVGDSDDMAF